MIGRLSLVCFLLLSLLIGKVSAAPLPSDFDKDGTVDFPDFLIFIEAWGAPLSADVGFDPRADLDASDTIDFNDFLIFIDTFGTTSDTGNGIGNGLEIVHGPNGPEGADRDNPFRSFTVHPTDANTILMGTERNGFVRTVDGGLTWTRHRSGLRHTGDLYPEVWDVAYDPADPDVVYAATLDSPGPVTGDFPSSIGGVYKSKDGGKTWVRKNCGFTSSRITGIEVVPGEPTGVIAGVEGGVDSFSQLQDEFFDGGLYRSTDGGDSWSRAVTAVDDSTNGYLHILARGNEILTFGKNLEDPSWNGGFLKTTDRGQSWETFAAGLRTLTLTKFAVSSNGETIVGNARDSFVLQVSEDSGQTWRVTEINQANSPVGISPASPERILFVSGQRTVNLSEDGLLSFAPVLTTPANIEEIVFAPSDPSIVYVTADGLLIYRSVDGGRSFELLVDIRADVLSEAGSSEL